MKYIIKSILTIMMITTLCSFLNLLFDNRPPEAKLAHKIVKDLSNKFKMQYGLDLSNLSEHGTDGIYVSLGFHLSYPYLLTKDQGRALLLACMTDILDAFNSNTNFRQYMVEYPFTDDNIDIHITIKPANGAKVYHPNILIFSFADDSLRYRTKKPDTEFGYYTDDRETQAKKILKDQLKANPPYPMAQT